MAYKDQNRTEADTETKIPKVFISYNHKDLEVALKIKDRLENAGIEVIIDKEAMTTGQNIAEFIKKCIKESGITVSLISANSLMSGWVAMETIWSHYDVTLRGRYFMPCNIDNYSYLDLSFVSKAHEFLKEEIKEIDNEIIYRRQNGIGIEDIQDDLTRLSRLISELPSIVGELKKSFCVNLNDKNFDHGIEKLTSDIKEALNINALTEPTETKAKLPTEQHGNNQPQKAEQESKLDVADEIKRGNILYKIADTMQLNRTERCEIRIAKNIIPLIELSNGLEVDGVKIKENVKVSDDMEVKLIPFHNKAFKIVNITNQEQLLDDDSFTQWIFHVTPLIIGNQLLTLVVSTITRNIHNEEIKNDVVFERIINVVTSEGEIKRSHDMDHKEEIEQLILKGNLASAISELLKYTELNGQKDLHDLLIGQSSRFNTNENDNLAGLLSQQDYQRTKNQITFALISILKRYGQPLMPKPNDYKKYLLYSVIGLGLWIIINVLNINILPSNLDNRQDIKVDGPTVKPIKKEKINDTDKNIVDEDNNAKKIKEIQRDENRKVKQPKKEEPRKTKIVDSMDKFNVLDTNLKKNEVLPKVEIPKPTHDSTKIVGPQMIDIELILSKKYIDAKILVDSIDALIIDVGNSIKTIRVEQNKNHVFKFVSNDGSCKKVDRFVSASDNQQIIIK